MRATVKLNLINRRQKTWQMQWPNGNGGVCYETIGPSKGPGRINKARAHELLAEKRKALEDGTASVRPDSTMLISEYMAVVIERKAESVKKGSVVGWNGCVANLIRAVSDIRICDLDEHTAPAHFKRYMGKERQVRCAAGFRTAPPAAHTTVTNQMKALRRLFKLAVEWGFLHKNPFGQIIINQGNTVAGDFHEGAGREVERYGIRADGELLHAVSGGLLGADTPGMEPRQPHRRLPGRRSRPEPADRVPGARGRLQPVPRLRGSAGVGTGWDRERDGAAVPRRG